jgi:predicted ferric reductase
VIRRRKVVLVSLIALSCTSPLLFVDLREPTTGLAAAKLLAKVGSLSGMVLFAWQFLLGFRGAVAGVLTDLVWVVKLHRRLGQLACGLILLHPVFISIYYIGTGEPNPLLPDPGTAFGWMVVVGFVALALVALLYLTSVPLRSRLRTLTWFRLHILSYLMLALGFVHSFAIGSTVRQSRLVYGWVGLAAVVSLMYGYRALFRWGVFAREYVVTRVAPAAARVVEIVLRPVGRGVVPKIGQFVYFRRGRRLSAQPYTVTAFDEQSGELSITAKALGRRSTMLQNLTPGPRVGIDGPYGVFGWAALASGRPLVMIAGGIGITPFRRIIDTLEEVRDRPAFLFYGNRRSGDIVYRQELQACRHVKVVNVLNAEPDYPGHQGFITVGLLRDYCGADLGRYEFLICGPPVMVWKLEEALGRAHVVSSRIHHELFSW